MARDGKADPDERQRRGFRDGRDDGNRRHGAGQQRVVDEAVRHGIHRERAGDDRQDNEKTPSPSGRSVATRDAEMGPKIWAPAPSNSLNPVHVPNSPGWSVPKTKPVSN